MKIQISIYKLIPVLFVAFFMMSCDSDKSSDSDNRTLQNARGETGEIIMVVPPNLLEGELGVLLRDIFSSNIKALPQEEKLYNLNTVDPSKFNSVFKSAKNLVFVATLDNKQAEGKYMKKYFTENSLEQIEKKSNLFSFNQKDVYARGQEVLYLFGRNEEELIENIKNNKAGIKEFFNDKEAERLIAGLKKTAQKGIMNFIEDTIGLEVIIPAGYDIAYKGSDYVWLRELDTKIEYNIWAVRMPYTDQSVFVPENVKILRDSLAKKYITDKDDKDLYLTSQDEVDFVIDTINLNNNYALRVRGLWKYSDNARGGAFAGYLFADEQKGELYYLEGYVDAPSTDKREPMRRLKAILETATIPQGIKD